MRYFNILLVCGLLMVANAANAQTSYYEHERLRIEREKLELQRRQQSQQQQIYVPKSSLGDNIQGLMKSGIEIQKLRDRQRRTDILQQQGVNASIDRVNTLIRNGNFEAAEQMLNNDPSMKAKGYVVKVSPDKNIIERRSTKTGELKTFVYDVSDPLRTMKEVSRSESGLQTDVPAISRVPVITERSQVDVKTGIAKNRAEAQTGGKPSAWFLVSMGDDKKWKINDTFEHLAECKNYRAVDPTNTVCVPSDSLKALTNP